MFYRARQVRLGKMVFRYLFTSNYYIPKMFIYYYYSFYFIIYYTSYYYCIYYHTIINIICFGTHNLQSCSDDNHACQHDYIFSFIFFWPKNHKHRHTPTHNSTHARIDPNKTTHIKRV